MFSKFRKSILERTNDQDYANVHKIKFCTAGIVIKELFDT
jgi:hypothetical protein